MEGIRLRGVNKYQLNNFSSNIVLYKRFVLLIPKYFLYSNAIDLDDTISGKLWLKTLQ